MSNSPLPPDVPEATSRGEQVLAVSGSMPRTGEALPEITLTAGQEVSRGVTTAATESAEPEGATWQFGDQLLTVSGSMPRSGTGLPELTLEPTSVEVEVRKEQATTGGGIAR